MDIIESLTESLKTFNLFNLSDRMKQPEIQAKVKKIAAVSLIAGTGAIIGAAIASFSATPIVLGAVSGAGILFSVTATVFAIYNITMGLCSSKSKPENSVIPETNSSEDPVIPDSGVNTKARKTYFDASMILGPEKWKECFGVDVEAISPPENIREILNSPCPIWPDKKVLETHTLVFIPAMVDGEQLTLNKWITICKSNQEGGDAVPVRYLYQRVINQCGNIPVPEPHWILLTNTVLPNSRFKSYASQQNIVRDLANQSNKNYEVPHILDIFIGIGMKYVDSKERLFGNDPWTYTRCQESVTYSQVVIGGFAPAGLSVDIIHVHDPIGVAALRKF